MDKVEPGVYKHFKGGEYEVYGVAEPSNPAKFFYLCTAIHSENRKPVRLYVALELPAPRFVIGDAYIDESLVIYRPCYGERLLTVRPLSMWNDHIERDDYSGPRFTLAVPVIGDSFQSRVQPWMMACFGPEISADTIERNHRFLEESLELVQALGCAQAEARQLVDYVYSRSTGEPRQEVGGVMVTLAALCLAQELDMHSAGEAELSRIWTKIKQIRAKQAAKPRNSPLPAPPVAKEMKDD